MKVRAGLAVVALGLAVAGCSSTDTATVTSTSAAGGGQTSSPSSELKTGGPGTYVVELPETLQALSAGGEMGGGVITYEIPASTSDPDVAKAEAVRLQVGAPEVGYVKATMDNTSGTKKTFVFGVKIVGEDGAAVTASAGSDVLTKWRDLGGEMDQKSGGVDNYNAVIDLQNSLATGNNVSPGEKVSVLLISEKPIASVKNVFASHEFASGEFQAEKQ